MTKAIELTDADFSELRETRARSPQSVGEAFAERARRPLLREDNRLFIIAADHPARGSLGVRDEGLAMADRYGLLQRLATALERPGVDGVLGTPDVIEDLALLGLLDDKVVVGSMNRGGLSGSTFEMDDRFTGYDIDAIVRDRLDFGKTLLRINLEDPATVVTLEANAAAVDAAARARTPIMLEPFMSRWESGRIRNDLSRDAVIRSVGIAQALGSTSAFTWLKLPVVPGMADVMAATTLPTLLLGGDPRESADTTFEGWARALSLPGVRGLVVGRTLLYPPDGDVGGAVDRAAALVHGAVS